MTRLITKTILLIMLTSLGYSCSKSSNGQEPRVSYADSLKLVRTQLNKELKNNLNSPIPKSKRERFVGLKYFSPNPQWNVTTKLTLLDANEKVIMVTSTGEQRDMVKLCKLNFIYEEEQFELYGYGEFNSSFKELFIPFFDETNGVETYPGGRYLEIPLIESDSIKLDFNLAINPYCHYNTGYSCPIPPISNTLAIRVDAGEKLLY